MITLVISDLHAPYHHPDAVDFLRDVRKRYKPDRVVCIGDETDSHAWSRHDPSPECKGAADELAAARDVLKQLYRLFPAVNVCRSNHGDRAVKAAARVRLPSALLRTTADVLGAPLAWQWASEWIIDGVLYCHGEGVSGINAARTAAVRNRCSTVIGHIHTGAGVQYIGGPRDTVWGMNVGCLIDASKPAFDYARVNTCRSVLGTGVVVDGVPHFLPLE